MNATELMNTLSSAGVRLALNPVGGITASGSAATIARHREAIRAHKPELLALLTRAPAPAPEADPRLATVAAFLAAINEPHDSRADVMGRCAADPECLAYFLEYIAAWNPPEATP